MFKTIYIIIFLFLSTEYIKAQEIITGTIHSKGNTPIEMATVTLLSSDSTFIAGGITDQTGLYSITSSKVPSFIRVTSIGYADYFSKWCPEITLQEEITNLQEVVISSRRPQMKFKNGNLVMQVTGTQLAKETKISSLLRKIPGLTDNGNGGILTIDGNVPTIYVNGRKVEDLAEISSIDIKTIKNIELDNTPGARYGGNIKAVLNIETIKPGEGMSLLFDTYEQFNHAFSHDHKFDVSYTKNQLTIFGGLNYSDYRRKSYQDISTDIYKETEGVENIKEILKGDNISDKTFGFNTGIDFNSGEKLSGGFKYIGTFIKPRYFTSFESNASWYNLGQHNSIIGNSQTIDNTSKHHLNAYLQYKHNNKLTTQVYADLFSTSGDRCQNTYETSDSYRDSITSLQTHSNYTLASVNPIVNYSLAKNSSLQFGSEYTGVWGKTKLDYIESGNGSKYNTSENTFGVFSNFSIQSGHIFIKLGLRYEWVKSIIDNLTEGKDDFHRTYGNLLANLTASIRWSNTSHTLTLNTSVNRPSFGCLNNYAYYINQYSYQEGNPTLKPATTYQLKYDFLFKFLYFSLSYKYTKDYIGMYFYNSSDHPNAFITTWVNYESRQQLLATLNMHKAWDSYESSLTLSGIYSKIGLGNFTSNIKEQPQLCVTFNNTISLPYDISLNIEYLFKSRCTRDYYTHRSKNIFNIHISKSLCNNQLELDIFGDDIFRNNISRYNGTINNITISQYEDQDRRAIGVELIWRLHNYKKKYKGKTSGQNVINRL